MLELGERGSPVFHTEFREFGFRARAAVLVDCDAAGDRERPRAQVLSVTQARVRAKCAKKRLLEGVLRALAAEPPYEEGEDLVAVELIEPFERGHGHLDIF